MGSRSSTTSRYYLVLITLFQLLVTNVCSGEYYGKLIGKLSELNHGVSGEVYAVDARTLFIKDFTYDGEGPTAYFYAGNSKSPITNGFRIRDERGMSGPLRRYRKKGITLTLPEGKTLNTVKWFAVWCDEFAVNFGDVRIPRGFDYPKPQKLQALNGVHGVSSEPVVIVDAQTLLIPGFSYDGEAPDAKFWVGPGAHPSPQGILVPDENGKVVPLRRYDRKTIVLTLPGDLTVLQLGHFGVWCEAFTVDFGHIQIPQNLNIPPSLKMLGVSPQSKLNCEVLEDNLAFEVRWAVAGDSIVVQLVGKLNTGQYMSFGVSANPERSQMIGGDVVVAWVDKQTLQGYAVDYFLDAKSQCSGGRGSCPDSRIQDNTNSVRLLNAAMVNGYSIVTYQRPLGASDELDRQIRTNGTQAIIWAIGPLNERNEVSFHSHWLKTDRFIEFGRPPSWNCPMPDTEQMDNTHDDSHDRMTSNQELMPTTRRPSRPPATPAPSSTNGAWEIPPIECDDPEDGVLYAQMGPTGGKHGYPAITGHVGWGISWYINGLLIPEINVVRGKTYTFVVEGGDDADKPALYHPFYITDDPIGGYAHKTPEERARVKIFAGIQRQRGTVVPTGTGRWCSWLHDQDAPDADDYTSFGAFQRTLTLKCNPGDPGIVQWTPDKNTPDTVYYQCFTHRYLGWKINVHDSCDVHQGQASENHEFYIKTDLNKQTDDLDSASSINLSSKVTTPVPDFYKPAKQDYDKRQFNYINMKYHHQQNQKPSSLIYQANNALNKPTQMMIIRRPIRRPQHHQLMSQELPHFMERKKSIYREPMKHPQLGKIGKIDKQVMKIEQKMTINNNNNNDDDVGVKPARNTGFNPDSIVIEGGFKPIIRGVERNDDSARSQDYSMFNWDDKKIDKDETFEPVYHGSMQQDGRKRGNKVQNDRVGQRLDDVDDMEMAADGLDAYYLPPPSGQKALSTTTTTKRLDERLTGTLITFDGKKVKDSSLARSISGRTNDQSSSGRYQNSKLSDVLTKTPQFGKFRGELPPPIPGDGRPIDFKRSETEGSTKLMIQRSRRASDIDNYGSKNVTENIQDNHHHHNHDNNDHYEENEQLTLASTGQMIITNIEYVFLTVILYFAM